LSSKKLKLLESAQKFIAKGQLDKAIKDYEQIVALDQNDIKQRQKLAEMLVRVNRKEEAIAEYEIIAKHYSQGLFYLKAIAVHKQIQKIEPDNINTRLALASLYAKQGMSGNALTEFNYAADYFQKGGSTAEAFKVIELMVEADPDNLKSRNRLAEACYDAGQSDRAYMEYINLALRYRKNHDEAFYSKINEKVAKIFPDKRDFAIDVLSSQVRDGDAAGAIPHLKELVNKEKTNLKAWELLAECYLSTGETRERKETLRRIMENFPDRLSVAESLIQTSIEEADIAGSIDLLNSYGPKFVEKGAVRTLEKLYLSLRETSPDDQAVLKELKNLYETSGEGEKLASLTAVEEPVSSIEIESLDAPEMPAVEIPPEPPVEPSSEKPPGPPADMSWEEEIDLSILDEEGSGPFSADTGVPGTDFYAAESGIPDSAEVGAELGEIQKSEDFSIESEEFSEISLEIDESEIPHGDWQEELPPEEQVNISWTAPESEASEPEGLTGLEEKETLAAIEITTLAEKEPPLAEVAEIAEKPEESPPFGRKRKKYDLDGQFSEFKKGVDQQLDEGDTETHYNLGIAYKEMGLYDDAVSEFRIAAIDPKRKIDCLTLQGICFRDKGDFTGAEELFKNALSLEGLTDEEKLSINYELAFLCEIMGRKEESVQIYRRVLSINPGFRDAAKKIAYLQGIEEGEETELLELDAEDLD